MGFVTKVESQEMLMSKPNGSFLLRFSDSELGGITIAWVADQEGLYQLFNPFLGQWNVPYTFKQLSKDWATGYNFQQNIVFLSLKIELVLANSERQTVQAFTVCQSTPLWISSLHRLKNILFY